MHVHSLTTLLVASLLTLTSTYATPQLQLRVTRGTQSTTAVDTGHAGQVAFSGVLGDFLATYVAGLGDPLLFQPHGYQIDLSGQVTANALGAMTIALTETDLEQPLGPLNFSQSFSGTLPTGWTISVDGYMDLGNVAYGTTDHLFTGNFAAPSGPPASAFGIDATQSAQMSGAPFSITDIVTLTATSTHHPASFDLTTTDLPEPSSLLPLAVGLLGMGLLLRRCAVGGA